jgi:hypothetical protein
MIDQVVLGPDGFEETVGRTASPKHENAHIRGRLPRRDVVVFDQIKVALEAKFGGQVTGSVDDHGVGVDPGDDVVSA